MTHCDAFPDVFPGKSMLDVSGLSESVVTVARDVESWTTIFECRLCGQVWEESFREAGHGEIPTLRKLESIR